jgi:F0F1-type ATP synthase beta subunit
MKRLRLILVLVLLAVLAGAAWVWYATPVPVDLANYAPANALVYMEFDNLADVARTIQHTDIWKAAAPITGNSRVLKSLLWLWA